VRAEGREGIKRVIDAAEPLDAVLWARALVAHPVASPDDAAELEEALKSDVARIAHEGVRTHYRAELLARFNEAYGYRARMRRGGENRRDSGGWKGQRRDANFIAGPLAITKKRVQAEQNAIRRDTGRLLKALLDRPVLISLFAERLAGLDVADEALCQLRDGLMAFTEQEETVDKLVLERHLAGFGVDMTAAWVREESAFKAAPVFSERASDAEAATAWTREADRHHHRLHGREERRDLAEAVLAGVDAGDRESERRFAAAARGLTGGAPEDEDDGGGEAARTTRARFDAALRALNEAQAAKTRKTKR